MKKQTIMLATTLIFAFLLCGAVSAADNGTTSDANTLAPAATVTASSAPVTSDSAPSDSATTITSAAATQTANANNNAADLVISNFQAPTTANVGNTYPVTVTVTNKGNVNADPFPVYLWNNGVLAGQQTVNNGLAAGQNTDVVFNWIPTTAGTQKLQTGLNLNDLITETTLYDAGTGSTQITYPSTSNSIEYNGLWNLTNKTIISTVMWNTNNIADEYDVEIYNDTKYAKWSYQQNRMVAGIWWDIGLSRNDAVYYNGFTDADLAHITKIKITFYTPTTGTKTAYLQKIVLRDIINTQGYVTFRFDDGTQDQYDNAYTMMQTYGYKGSIFPVINWVGYPGMITVNELNTLYNNGWDIGSHTMNHPVIYNLTEAQMRAELADSKQWLIAHGYTNSADLFVAPYFAMNPTFYNLIKEYYKTSGVGQADVNAVLYGVPGGIASIPFPAPNFFQASTTDISIYNLPESFPTALNAVANKGEWIIILTHTVSTDTEKANFASLLAAVQASGVQVKTFSEMYDLMNRAPTKQVTVTAQALPDLVVSNLQVPSNPQVGNTYPVTVTVTNSGTANAGSFQASLKDGTTTIGTQTITSLATGQSTTITLNWIPTTTGLRTINATTDTNNQITETNENNNSITQQTTVTQNLPDLTITNFQTPTSAKTGTASPITVTITNSGSANAGSFLVYLMENNRRVGSQTVTSLAAGQSINVVFNWVPTTVGVRNLQVRVDPTNLITESNETNNLSPVKQVTVT